MNESVLVGMLQPYRRLANQLACISHRQSAKVLDQLGEIEALHVFHDENASALNLSGIVSADNIGMV